MANSIGSRALVEWQSWCQATVKEGTLGECGHGARSWTSAGHIQLPQLWPLTLAFSSTSGFPLHYSPVRLGLQPPQPALEP